MGGSYMACSPQKVTSHRDLSLSQKVFISRQGVDPKDSRQVRRLRTMVMQELGIQVPSVRAMQRIVTSIQRMKRRRASSLGEGREGVQFVNARAFIACGEG